MKGRDEGQQVLAVIPARSRSKNIPGKNLLNLGGKPLVAWTIEAALKAKGLDRVVVSTDGEEIAELARVRGVEEVVMRPSYLATDSAPIPPVIRHALQVLEEKEEHRFDVIMTLQPTSPLRDHGDIEEALHLFLSSGADSLVGVCEVEHHPYKMVTVEDGRMRSLMVKGMEHASRQDLPKVYRHNGAIYITRRSILMDEGRFLGNDTLSFIMPQEKSIDINTLIDFKVAEYIIKLMRQ